jgi:hypothetical protein
MKKIRAGTCVFELDITPKRCPPKSTLDIENILPGPNLREFHQAGRRWCRKRFKRCEMLPALPLRLLEFGITQRFMDRLLP